MAERPRLIAGNWKMNGLRADGLVLAAGLAQRLKSSPVRSELLVCPPTTLLTLVAEALQGSEIALGGQDCHPEPKGPFPGSISAEMLRDVGCSYVIVGHSERRKGFGESNDETKAKVLAAWRAGLTPIVCIGESGEERNSGRATEVIRSQVAGSVPKVGTTAKLIVAYEPVWAIGTGLHQAAHDIAQMLAIIRSVVPTHTRILYGGSVNPKNCAEIFALQGVDGALVGAASLDVEDFWEIVRLSNN
jgi:triosephosphate isomerase